jgi:hypothetical protein
MKNTKPKHLKVIYDGKVIWDADVTEMHYSQQRHNAYVEIPDLHHTVAILPGRTTYFELSAKHRLPTKKRKKILVDALGVFAK